MFYYLQILINKKDKNKDKKIQVATQTYKKWEFTRVSISCLIQGINYCLQIYKYILELYSYSSYNWLASNILLLASKNCFLTRQGLVGAGMNCRALTGFDLTF
jgi:hypothetical protein